MTSLHAAQIYRPFSLPALILALAVLAPVCGYAADTGAEEAGLEMALTSAVSRAKAVDDLDPAYELVGIAGAAHQRGFPRIAAEADEVFVDLVRRAAAAAAQAGPPRTDDTLDQLVDLRFFARSTSILTIQAALDDALRRLFPLVAEGVRRHADATAVLEEKLAVLSELAFLQAAATQVNLEDIAREMAEAYAAEESKLAAQVESDAAESARIREGLITARQIREDLMKQAEAENINVVAEQMKSGEGRAAGGDRLIPGNGEADEPLDEDGPDCAELPFGAPQSDVPPDPACAPQ